MPRDILIDPQRTGSGNPNIQFSGSAGNPLRLEVLSEGSVQFTGVSGSLFKISDFPVAGGGLNSLFLSGTTAITGSFLPGVTDLYDLGSSTKRWANIFATSISGSLTGSNVLSGQVVVAGTGGVLSGSNVFWWDNTNKRVGIGTSSGLTTLLYLTGSSSDGITIRTDTAPRVSYQRSSDGQGWSAGYDIVNNGFVISQSPTSLTTTQRLFINSGGYVGVGTVTPLARFYITGSSTASDTTFLVREGVTSPVGSANILNVQNSSGTSILMVSGSGKVGIGAAPAYSSPLYVFGNNSFPQITAAGSSGISPNGTSGYNLKIDSTDLWQLITDNNASNFFFLQYNNTSLGRYLSVSTTGNVGIGTTIPNSNSGYTTLTLASSTTGGRTDYNQSSTAVGSIYNDSSALYVQGNASKILVLGTNASEKVRIDTSGNVGIGTATPAALLTVSGTIVTKYSTGLESYIAAGTYSAGAAGFYPIYNTQSATGGLFGANDTVIKYAAAGNNFVLLHGTTVVMTANSSESVGIGSTTSISARFQVSGSSTSSTPTMIVREGVVSPTAGVGVFDVQNSAGTSILFVTGSQRVGIGTTAPQAAFHVVNGSVPNAANLYVGYVGSNNYYDANQHYYRDGSGNTRLTISSGGNVAPGSDNTQDLGSTALRWRNVYAASVSGSLTGSNVLAGQVVVAGTGGVLSGTNNFTYDNSTGNLTISGSLRSVYSVGDEGGEIFFAKPQTNTSINTGVTIDMYQNKIRIFETGGTNRGGYFDITSLGAAASTNLAGSGGATSTNYWFESAINTIYSTGSVGVGTNSYAARFFVSGSSTASTPTMIVREGVSSPTSGVGILNVQNSAGTSILFVTGSGNVGIGNTTPSYAMDVVGQVKTRLQTSGNATGIIIGNNGSEQPHIQFTASDNSARFKMQVNSVNAASERLSFYAGPLGGTATNEAMIIGGNGNVGIGTGTLATSRLLVTGSGATSSTSTMHLVNSSNSSLLFVRDDGNVGIGSSSPGYTLQIGSGASVGTRTLALLDSGYGIVIKGGNGNGIVQSIGTTVPLELQAGNGNNGNYYFTSTGNVGIGTAAASSKLFVYTTQNDATATPSVDINAAFARIGDATTGLTFNNGVGIKFHDAGTVHYSIGQLSGNFYMSQTSDNGNVLFSPARTDVIVFNSSGNVGIGSTTPGYKLDVNGDINLASTKILRVNGTAVVNTQGSNGSDIYMNARVVRNESSVNTDGLYLGYGNSGTTTGHIRFFANGTTERMKIAADTGSVIISDLAGSVSTSTARLLVSGSSTATVSTMVVKEGVASAAGGAATLDVQNSSGTSLLFVSGSGFVGIGTSTPSSPAFPIAGGKFQVSSSNTGTSAFGLIVGAQFVGYSFNYYDASTHIFRHSDGSTRKISLDSNGNVGIGNVAAIGSGYSPLARLMVTGSSDSTAAGLTVKSGLPSPVASVLDIQNNDGTTLFFVSGSGNVGIGTNISNGNKLSVSGETAITGSVTPGVDNTYSLGSSGKRWKTIYVATGSIANVVFSPVSTGATYVTTFASGESGRLTATKTINSSTNTTFFTVAENNGASMFDVSFVVSEGGFSVARKYSVASQYGTSSTNVVSFKTVDTGPYSGNDLTVTFTKTSATVTTCTVSQNSGGAVNIAMTIDISAISSGGAPTTVTIF